MSLHPDQRRRDLAAIHMAAAQLGMDTGDANPESEYRAMLWSIGRVRSAGDLDWAGRQRVLDHLVSRGAKVARPRARPRAPEDRAPLLGKIDAMLLAAGRPDAYAHAMARRMFGVDDYRWCDPDQLRRIVAALTYDAQRHGRTPK